MKTGAAFLLNEDGSKQPIRLKLTDDFLCIQKRESSSKLRLADNIDPNLINKERHVKIRRQKCGGFGLSVKGGAEHGLPILISRMFKDQAAEKTGQLFVGDALIEVNGVNMELLQHEEAVSVLKKAGEEVVFKVKYFQPAFYFLTTSKDNNKTDNISNGMAGNCEKEKFDFTLEKKWKNVISIPLLCAFISNQKNTSTATLHISSHDGNNEANLLFVDTRACSDWSTFIYKNISLQNQLHIQQTNRSLALSEVIYHMCWVIEMLKENTTKNVFLLIKGPFISVHDTLPMINIGMLTTETKLKINECLLRRTRTVKGVPTEFSIDLIDDNDSVVTRKFFVEMAEEMLYLETNWYKCNYFEIKRLQFQSFNCLYNNKISVLKLHVNNGFELSTEAENYKFRFSQLKNSCDDGNQTLTLTFLDQHTSKPVSWVLEKSQVQPILFSINAFLSAKLSSLDPVYLLSQTHL